MSELQSAEFLEFIFACCDSRAALRAYSRLMAIHAAQYPATISVPVSYSPSSLTRATISVSLAMSVVR